MDIQHGFQIEQPSVFVPWKIHESDLRLLLDAYLHHVTEGYFTMSCVSLGGMAHELGFHFYPRQGGGLIELEFFRRSYADMQASYDDFQQHFEQGFGTPMHRWLGAEGFDRSVWSIGRVQIDHYVIDRFGPEEHMRIKITKDS